MRIVVLSGILLLAAPAAGAAPLTPEALRDELEGYLGQTVTVEAKYKECWGGAYVAIVGNAVKFHLARRGLDPKQDELRQQLQANLDSANTPLVNEESNIFATVSVVRNDGQFERAQPGEVPIVAQLLKVERAPGDIERFEKVLATKRAAAPKDPEVLHDVARDARNWARRYRSDELVSWSRERDREAIELRAAALPKAEVGPWIKLAERIITLLEDRQRAIDLLNVAFKNVAGDKAARAELARALEGLDATFYRGAWMPTAEFRALEGYVQVGAGAEARWVPKPAAEFHVVVETDVARKAPFPVQTDLAYEKDARNGKISAYMRPHQVSSVQLSSGPIGLPESVNHERATGADGQARIYSQWVMADGSRFYFVDGRLLTWYKTSDPFVLK